MIEYFPISKNIFYTMDIVGLFVGKKIRHNMSMLWLGRV